LRETMIEPNPNKREHAAKTMPIMKKARSQVAVALTLAKKEDIFDDVGAFWL